MGPIGENARCTLLGLPNTFLGGFDDGHCCDRIGDIFPCARDQAHNYTLLVIELL